MSRKLLTLTTVLLLPLSAQAATMPKSGTESVTTAQVTMSFSRLKLGDWSIDNYENAGVMRNNAGGKMFNNFAIHSMGSGEVVGKERIDHGGGVITDRDGDQIFEIWDGKRVEGGETGTTKLVGVQESSPAFLEQESGLLSNTSSTRRTSVLGL